MYTFLFSKSSSALLWLLDSLLRLCSEHVVLSHFDLCVQWLMMLSILNRDALSLVTVQSCLFLNWTGCLVYVLSGREAFFSDSGFHTVVLLTFLISFPEKPLAFQVSVPDVCRYMFMSSFTPQPNPWTRLAHELWGLELSLCLCGQHCACWAPGPFYAVVSVCMGPGYRGECWHFNC